MKTNEDRKVNIHAVLEMFTSGQLLFLGLRTRDVWVGQELVGRFACAVLFPYAATVVSNTRWDEALATPSQ